ncbi:hypothetical protein [Pseudoalteromonas sp. MB47]|uniref:hypothetical protein n=1 Tax=Pseudoalteromonas sp. MB47 TaxID=2588452 RepID=UPI00140BF20E|nr:hypothetical protein [Pseudoalteromonas sp. MB47]NHH89281.1 hypothetical protein [Pseudoalteromonas sp. MB47]
MLLTNCSIDRKLSVKLFYFLLSFSISFIIFLFFSSINGYLEASIDRNSYLQSFARGQTFFDYFDEHSILTYFTREWLWNEGGELLVSYIGSADLYLLLISFIILLVFISFVIYKTNLFYIVFIINPLFIDLAFSQVRIGVAFVFLSLAYILRQKKFLLVTFILMSLSIHTSSVIFVLGYFLIYISGHYTDLSQGGRFNYVVLVAFVASFMMGPMREIILTFLNDRRAEYPDVSSGIMYMSYWIVLLFTFMIAKSKVYLDNLSLFAIFILSVACFNVVFGFYSVRFIAVGLPFFAYAIHKSLHPLTLKVYMLIAYNSFNILLWYYWVLKF